MLIDHVETDRSLGIVFLDFPAWGDATVDITEDKSFCESAAGIVNGVFFRNRWISPELKYREQFVRLAVH